MKPWLKITLGTAGLLVVAAGVRLGMQTKAEAHRLLTNPIETRKIPNHRPIDFGLLYEDVSVTTADGLRLVGWYIGPENGALILLQHGYKSDRGEMLNEAVMLKRHGYGSLITTIRTHDMSDGQLITFGKHEMLDLAAWYDFARKQPGVDPERIAMLGNSLGGSLAIEFAAGQPKIKAVVTNSAFSSLEDTIETSVTFYTGLPPFPFAPLITLWAEREAAFDVSEVDAKKWIGRLSPRPVLLMQGGKDIAISTSSGQRLYDAAGEPKELWFEPSLEHTKFDTAMPDVYERRVTGFFDTYLTVR